MSKIIKLKESELKELVKQVINEATGSSNVMAIQTALKTAGYGNLLGTTGPNGDGVDGIYGNNTKRAVTAYQKANGISPATGYVGKITAPKLGVQPMTQKDAKTKLIGKVDPNLFKNAGKQKASIDATGVKKPELNNKLSDTTLSANIKPEWKKLIQINKISTRDSVPAMNAGQKECAKFVHDFTNKLNFVGNAWDAYNNDSVGTRVWSAFSNLKPDTVKKIESEWLKIHQAGGGKEKGPFNTEVMNLVNSLVPKTPPKLDLDDIVGIFYPKSGHHEEAFYNAGKPYFTNVNGKMTPGKTIESGQGWGMNTHIGYVGAIKKGVPIIFHNVHGQVYMDPVNNLFNGGRVAWVKKK